MMDPYHDSSFPKIDYYLVSLFVYLGFPPVTIYKGYWSLLLALASNLVDISSIHDCLSFLGPHSFVVISLPPDRLWQQPYSLVV